MLSLLVSKVGSEWTNLHNMLKKKRLHMRGRKPQKPEGAEMLIDLSAIDKCFQPYQSALDSCLSAVNRAVKMPPRSQLIFLSDDEYRIVKEYFAATHSSPIEEQKLEDEGDVMALEYLVGTLKETTAALEAYYEVASITKLFVDRIMQFQSERNAQGVTDFGLAVIDQESSDEHEGPVTY
jgi:hypothetical protein